MSLIKVKVVNTEISRREGISEKTGKPYKINSQEIIVELHDEVRKVAVNLPDNSSAYALGNYTIDPLKLISIGRFGFELNRYAEIKLVPVSSNEKPALFAKTA